MILFISKVTPEPTEPHLKKLAYTGEGQYRRKYFLQIFFWRYWDSNKFLYWNYLS